MARDGVDDDDSSADENKVINEEYKIWKKNVPFLYDTVITHSLTWPSLTCQWLPDKEQPKDADHTVHRIILGTHTSGQSSDHLMIAEVVLPKSPLESNGAEVADLYDEEKGELGSHTKSSARIRVKQTIHHEGEVNRARYMPQNPNIIATKTVKGDVLIFDRTKHETKAPEGQGCRPDIRLVGQKKEGYGLSWSKVNSGHVLSASEDGTVAHWNINDYNKTDINMKPLRLYTGHSEYVEDVDWHPEDGNIFGSVADDRMLMIWDTREAGDNSSKPSQKVQAHESGINCLAFAPSNGNLLITGSNDKTIALWDIRKLSTKLHSFESHTDDILQVAWSPHSPVHFASASADRRVHIWNLDAIGAEQTPDDAEDGPPELMFVHGGHTSKLTDLSWSPAAKWHIATAAEDNILQVWEPSRHLRAGAEAEVSAMELE